MLKERRLWLVLALLAGDAVASAAALVTAYAVRFQFDLIPAPLGVPPIEPYLSQIRLGAFLGSARLNWVISGCESGDGARDTPIDWYRALAAECVAAAQPFLLKQAPLGAEGITEGDGSYQKRDLRSGPDGMKRAHYIVEKPYLDGTQWMQFPKAA